MKRLFRKIGCSRGAVHTEYAFLVLTMVLSLSFAAQMMADGTRHAILAASAGFGPLRHGVSQPWNPGKPNDDTAGATALDDGGSEGSSDVCTTRTGRRNFRGEIPDTNANINDCP